MASSQHKNQHSDPRAIPRPTTLDPDESTTSSMHVGSISRAAATARLATSPPVASSATSPPVGLAAVAPQPQTETQLPLPGKQSNAQQLGSSSLRSALTAELDAASSSAHRLSSTPPLRALSPSNDGIIHAPRSQRAVESLEGMLEARPGSPASTVPHEDPDVVIRHLVKPSTEDLAGRGKRVPSTSGYTNSPLLSHRTSINPITAPDLDEFSSLQLEGGDVHRQVYRWAEDASQARINQRSKSFTAFRPPPESDVLDIQNIKVPGGFRRNFLRRTAVSPGPSDRYGTMESDTQQRRSPPTILTNSFIEFLTIYGHFAGEELEDDEDEDSEDYFSSVYDGDADDAALGEASALLTPRTPGGRKRQRRPRPGKGRSTPLDATLLLLKSFVGTGVLFLPRAFLNGGLVFSCVVLVAVAALSYYCFILLVNTRLKVEGSFGDMGGLLYGPIMRGLILASIVLSQFGFVSAYIVFVSQNLQAFVAAVSQCTTWIDIKWMVLMQLVLFAPLSLIRDISKLGFTALVADVFILLGLVYLYFFDITTIIAQGGLSDVVPFNPSTWTGFIGTAIFTFEGIGLIIPIQESMKKPTQFPPVLGMVMIVITIIFTSMGALSYGAFGSATKTVVLLNLPQNSRFVNAVQVLYSLAILLSTPLQLFPAIRILETELLTGSGKNNPRIKWKKNMFRFALVLLCALVAWGGASDLDKFVSIVGSFACVPLVYVYPPLLHYRAVAQSRWSKAADILLSIFGFAGMVYTTVLTARSWGQGGGESGGGVCT